MKKIKKILISFHEWNQQRWFIWSFIHTLVGVWFSLILTFWGEPLKLIKIEDGNRELSCLGVFLTILTIGWSFFCLVSQRYYEYHQSNLNIYEPSSGEKLLTIVNKSIIEICNNKHSSLLKRVIKLKNEQIENVNETPCKQLELIANELCSCLSQLFTQKDYNVRKTDISVRIFYNFPCEGNVWKVTDNVSADGSLTIDELLQQGTTFHYTLNNNEKFVFFNSKEEARKTNKYKPVENDDYDNTNCLKGSIACYKIVHSLNQKKLVQAIICISSYSKKFIKSDKPEDIITAKSNIQHFVMDAFSRRISIELSSLYLQLLKNKALKNQNKEATDSFSQKSE